MKKLLSVAMLLLTIGVMAGPSGALPARYGRGFDRRGHGHGCRERGWDNYYHYNNSGIGLAANIVGLVGVGLNIVRPAVATPVYTQPVYQTPVVLPAAPIYPQPVVVMPTPYYQTSAVVPQPIVLPHPVPYYVTPPPRPRVPLYW